jgi:HK97 family phage major capsid protein
MPLGTNQQTATTGAVFRPQVWANDVMTFLQANLVLLPLVHRYDSEVSSFGQSITVPFVVAGTANAKVANTQVTLDGTTYNSVVININQHFEKSYLIEDFLNVQSKYNLRSEFTKAAAYAIAVSIDSSIVTEFLSGVSQTAGTYGTAISDATILSGKLTLDNALAPADGRKFVINPTGYSQLLAIDKFVRYDALGTGEAIKNGKIGTIYGMDVFMSQNLPTVVATPAQNNGMMFHADVQGVAVQEKPRTQAQYKQEYLGWLLTVDALWGVKTLRPTFGVVIKY